MRALPWLAPALNVVVWTVAAMYILVAIQPPDLSFTYVWAIFASLVVAVLAARDAWLRYESRSKAEPEEPEEVPA